MGALFFRLRNLWVSYSLVLGEWKHYSLKAIVTTFPCNAKRTVYDHGFVNSFIHHVLRDPFSIKLMIALTLTLLILN